MKILFICAQNVGRSQAAAAITNKYFPEHQADSAGTNVESPGETIAERAEYIESARDMMLCLADEGMDISHNVRTAVTPEMLDKYDKVIVMAEPEKTPEWLRNSPKYEYWKVADPRGKSKEEVKKTHDEVKDLVFTLLGDVS